MKRFVTIFLALTMLAGMGSIAYAAEPDGSKRIEGLGGSASIEVPGRYVAAEAAETLYCVELSWDNLDFDCTVTGSRYWRPDIHTYVNDTKVEMQASEHGENPYQRRVTVTNRSNAKVDVSAKVQAETETYGFTLSVPEGQQNFQLETLADYPGMTPEGTEIHKHDIDVTVAPPAKADEAMPSGAITLGKLTVTVQAATP